MLIHDVANYEISNIIHSVKILQSRRYQQYKLILKLVYYYMAFKIIVIIITIIPQSPLRTSKIYAAGVCVCVLVECERKEPVTGRQRKSIIFRGSRTAASKSDRSARYNEVGARYISIGYCRLNHHTVFGFRGVTSCAFKTSVRSHNKNSTYQP